MSINRQQTDQFDYKRVFGAFEDALIEYGSQHKPRQEIQAALDQFKRFESRTLDDNQYYEILVLVAFYAGFRAATVNAKLDVIKKHFPSWEAVAAYSEDEVAAILADPHMIRNKAKINACVKNAKTFQAIIEQHGSFGRYVASFQPHDSFENLMRLKEALQTRLSYLGDITAYHFLTDIGFPVLKPDRVINRIFARLGLIESDDQLLESVLHGRRFAVATGFPLRYIDIVFVAYGQATSLEFGIDRGICLNKPRCHLCGATMYCQYYAQTTSGSSST